MPELVFRLRWPDGRDQICYSPSTVLREHLVPGTVRVDEFVRQVRAGLSAASDRVRARYGVPCSLALAQLTAIEAEAARHDAAAPITILSID